MEITITIITLLYALFTVFLMIGWLKIPRFKPNTFKNAKNMSQCQLSVVIVVRNEAENIGALLEDLNAQTLSSNVYEVFVVNDHSTDNTVELVQAHQLKVGYPLHLLHLTQDEFTQSPKKAGITKAIQQAKGKYIVTTDGDCRVSPQWLELYFEYYQANNAQLISGGVTFAPARTVFDKVQIVEFASLIGSGAASLQMGFPNMCNGANLSYTKQAFETVNGFAGTEHIASGDDEFLMHKIAQQYPQQIGFIKQPQSVVTTLPVPSLKKFFHQRKRWASKWSFYRDYKVKILAFFIFLCNFGLLFAFLMNIFSNYATTSFLMQLCIKNGIEFIFLTLILNYLNKQSLIWWIPAVQIIYPLYVVFFGLLAQRKSAYEWKGRKLN